MNAFRRLGRIVHGSAGSALAVTLLLAALAVPARGFWEEGHMLVAQIGLMNLSPQKAAIAQAFIAQMANQFPASPEFVTASVWPDDLKSMGIGYFSNWHYVDIPYAPDGFNAPPVDLENVAWSLDQAKTTLRASKSINYGYDFMVRWVIHAIGDIHQPLHAISLFSNTFPKGDRGGNDFLVKLDDGSTTNLHSLCDSVAHKYETPRLSRPLSPESHAILEGYARDLMAAHPNTSFSFTELRGMNFMTWANESYKLAVSHVYLNNALVLNAPVPPGYVNNLVAMIDRRIALGGYRLARFFELYLPNSVPAPAGSPPSPVPTPAPSPSPPPSPQCPPPVVAPVALDAAPVARISAGSATLIAIGTALLGIAIGVVATLLVSASLRKGPAYVGLGDEGRGGAGVDLQPLNAGPGPDEDAL